MNIGIVCYPTFGGSGVVATELGKALAAEGHNVHFITYQQPVRLDFFSENLFYHEVNIRDYPLFEYAPYESALASKLVDVVRFEKLDILHVHYAIPHASAAYMAKQILQTYDIDLPVVTTLHGTDITLVGKDPSYRSVVAFSINHSDGVTAVSENLKQETLDSFRITRDIEVIPNFIDFERFNVKPLNHFRKAIAPMGERILIHTSNFRAVKRTEDVIKIFGLINKQVPSRILMVGDGPERANCERLCRTLGICEHVRFLGKQEAVEEILNVSDLFLMPSESESFGLAALEAMACSVPVVSSNAGGLPELNIDGYSGYLADVGDIETMAARAVDILKNDETLAKFKHQAYARAKEFDLAIVLPAYIKLYTRLINKEA